MVAGGMIKKRRKRIKLDEKNKESERAHRGKEIGLGVRREQRMKCGLCRRIPHF